jgi:hypothetical protein
LNYKVREARRKGHGKMSAVTGAVSAVAPSAVTGAFGGLVLVAAAATAATRGIGGVSARQGMIFGLSWPAGFAALPAFRNRT